MIVGQLLGIFLWLVIVPFCLGLIPIRFVYREKRNAGVVLIGGYLVMFSLFWLVTVPAVIFIKYDNFLFVVQVFTIMVTIMSLIGVLLTVWACKQGTWISIKTSFNMKDSSLEEKLMWILFFALLLFQFYKAFTITSFDGDDAEYVVRSLIAQQSNVMYTILPYTGGTADLDIRHALAVLPIWIGYIGRMTNIHSTIVSHSVIPFAFISLTYIVYFEIGKCLLKKKKMLIPAFMTLMALLQIFGNVSIYTSETFFLTRTWQGKSFAANFIMPVVIWLLLLIFDKKEDGKSVEKKEDFGLWLLLWLVNMTAGICSSQAVFFCMMIIGIVAFFMAVSERKFSILVKCGFACIPNVAYMLLYLFLH